MLKLLEILIFCLIKTIKKWNKTTKRRISGNTSRYFRINLAMKFIIRKRNCKSWLWKRMRFLMPPHPLTNFKIQKYYQNEPRFNGVFSRDNLPKKNKGWDMRNKPWWICRRWYTLVYFIREMKLFISIVLVLNMFLNKFKNLSGIKI